jgi:acyl-CoA synthetase (AMP-forming)/AMP-acid ligase II
MANAPFSLVARTSRAVRTLHEVGLLDPRFMLSYARAAIEHGQSLALGIAAASRLRPREVAIIDDAGELLFAELEARVLSIAAGLREAGVGPGHNVGILCRNHRGFVEATAAVSAIGADALFLNTGFAGPQLNDVLVRENAKTLIYDEEFSNVVEAHAGKCQRFLAWHESDTTVPTLDELARDYPPTTPARLSKAGAVTILTSGTTGTPKGAARDSTSADAEGQIGVLEVMPVRVGATTLVCAPTFHAWGLTHSLMAMMFGSTIVLHQRFDALRTLEAIEQHQIDTLVVVPVMMQRILALGDEAIGEFDVSSLRATLSSGSALPGELAIAWMDAFGDNLHNFYGSTEVAQATCAGPADLRAAPGTAGRPPRGVVVKILDDKGKPLPQGKTGRIFVGNGSQFDGYTGGGGKEMIDGLMSIGDVGYFDPEGRLFVEGRDDDMIISGGENVFPREVEDLLSDCDEIAEAAVIGVADEQFGQRLRAFVVLSEGATLDEQAIKELVRVQLARHKIPKDVIFLDEIPRNATGKVLKRELRDYAQPR